MPLDPQVRTVLDALAAMDRPPWEELEPEQARNAYREVIEARQGAAYQPVPVGSIHDERVDGPGGDLPVRVYSPDDANGNDPLPLVVFFHGGGWVIGDVDTHDAMARTMCRGTGAVVVSVDYRLAPEHPYPAAVQDCLAATRWARTDADRLGVDPDKVAVAGDSAGGNLAAVVAQRCRDEGFPLVAQLLVYPIADVSREHASMREHAEGYYLERSTMRWFIGHYVRDDRDRADPGVSPLLGDLRGLSPAVICTAEFDPLRDEGEAYAAALREAGVPVQVTRYEGRSTGSSEWAVRSTRPRGR